MIKLAIITGSTRPQRVNESVVRWVYEIARQRQDAEFELVDIKDFDLPLLDEPVPPSMGQYSQPHTKAWAAKIDSFAGYVFVTRSTTTGYRVHSKTRLIFYTASGITRRQDSSATAAPAECARWRVCDW
jgi:hypothetical protein